MAAVPIALRLYQALCVLLKCFKIYSRVMLVLLCLLSHPLHLGVQDRTQILTVPFPRALPSSLCYNPYKLAIQSPNCLPRCAFRPQQGIPQVVAQRKAWRTIPEGTGVVEKPGRKLCHRTTHVTRKVGEVAQLWKTGLGTVSHAPLAWPAYSTNSWICAVKGRALGGCRDSCDWVRLPEVLETRRFKGVNANPFSKGCEVYRLSSGLPGKELIFGLHACADETFNCRSYKARTSTLVLAQRKNFIMRSIKKHMHGFREIAHQLKTHTSRGSGFNPQAPTFCTYPHRTHTCACD